MMTIVNKKQLLHASMIIVSWFVSCVMMTIARRTWSRAMTITVKRPKSCAMMIMHCEKDAVICYDNHCEQQAKVICPPQMANDLGC